MRASEALTITSLGRPPECREPASPDYTPRQSESFEMFRYRLSFSNICVQPMKEHFAEDDEKNGLKFDKKSTEGAKSAPKDAASGSTLADITESAKDVFDTASSKAKEALDSAVEVGKSAADALSKQAHQAAEVIGEKAGQVGGYINDWVSSFQGKKDEAKRSAEL